MKVNRGFRMVFLFLLRGEMFAGSSSELYQIVNMMSALENKCLQEAVLTLCSGSLRCFALTYFSARCANADKSGYGAGVSEACNFNAVVDFLTISYSFVIVTDACETRQWILGDPADSFLGCRARARAGVLHAHASTSG